MKNKNSITITSTVVTKAVVNNFTFRNMKVRN